MSNKQAWLEQALSRDLTKVEAPPELWERVQPGAEIRREQGARPLVWAFAAALSALALVLGMRHEPHAAGVAVAAELQSGDPTEIRAWAKRSAGLDIALPAALEPSVQLLSARVVNPAAPAVEVSYRVRGQAATLLVARNSGPMGMRHADLRTLNNDGRISWVLHGQVYTLTCFNPEDARAACLLCHVS